MHYRPEIDGLRALAVLAVIFSHVGLAGFAGGFVGVDVFFVISGYLITSILLRDIANGAFSFTDFYVRRAKRILPALFFVLFVTFVVAWHVLLPTEFRAYSKTLIASTLSVSNFYFMATTDYFAPEATSIALLHTWSLAVEEQFYLLFPVFLIVLARKNLVLSGLSIVSVVSFLLGCLLVNSHPLEAYYLLPTRAWELLAGGILASLSRTQIIKPNAILALIGLALILLAIFLFDGGTSMPSGYTLIPVAGAVLYIAYSKEGIVASFGLSHRSVVFVGKVSFSAYLWHQPVFVFARQLGWVTSTWDVQIILVLLTFALAVITYFMVEVPFRKSNAIGLPLADFVLRAGAILVSIGIWILADKGLPLRGGYDQAQTIEQNRKWSSRCLKGRGDPIIDVYAASCKFGANINGRIAIWGDSIASSITPSLAKLVLADGFRVEQFTFTGCMPVINVARGSIGGSHHCKEFNNRVLNYLESEDIDGVVMFASWVNSLGMDAVTIGETQHSPSTLAEPFLQEWKATISRLIFAGKKVFVVLPMYDGEQEVAASIYRKVWFRHADPEFRVSRKEFVANTEFSVKLLSQLDQDAVTFVDPKDVFCSATDMQSCSLSDGATPYIADRRHFTGVGADKLAVLIYDKIKHLN